MLKTVRLEDAVGLKLNHDITEIRPGEFKGPAFRKGHTVCEEDLCHLQRLGKKRLYKIELAEDEMHENEAAAMLAEALAGNGVMFQNEPKEGKINLSAAIDGMLIVDTVSLAAFNMQAEVMCATLHSYTLVQKGELIAATRAIPLVMKRASIERAAAIAGQNGGVVAIRPLQKSKVGLIITGSEIYQGLIEDRFASVLTNKVKALGSEIATLAYAPDDAEIISQLIRSQLDQECDLLLLTGGMSVDPDDVTRHGIRMAGAAEILYGSAVLPGAMFLVAYLGDIPLLGVPACALYHQTTVLDLILPRVLAGEKIGPKELASLGHGGLCRNCPQCAYPHCPFGKGI